MAPNKLFPLDLSTVGSLALVTSEKSASWLWHLRYGHLHQQGLKLLNSKGMVYGLPEIESIDLCEGCIYGKQHRKLFPSSGAWRASHLLELIHMDVCEPMQIASLGGNKYFLLITGDYIRMSWVYFLENKREVFAQFKMFKVKAENQSGLKIKTLRTDNGGEFVSEEFNHFCDENGIHRALTTPYTPEQNMVAEWKNRTVVEMARSMLKEKNLPNQF